MNRLPRALRPLFERSPAPEHEFDADAAAPEALADWDDEPAPSPRRRRTIVHHTSLWTLKVTLTLAALLLIVLAAAWARLSVAPLQLPALTERVEAELSAARDGRPVRIDGVDLSWSGEPRALQLKARGVHILSADGQEISTFREASIGLGVLPLFIGRVTLVRAEFIGGEISVTRKADGALNIAFGPPGSPADIVVPPTNDNAPLAQRVNKWLDDLERTLRPVGRAGRLQSIELRQAQLQILDEGGGGRWRADEAVIVLNRTHNALALAVDARLEGAEGAAPAQIRVTTDTKFRTALIEFSTNNARPRALFSPAALGVFAGVDAPLTAAITIGLDREVGVNRFEGDLILGAGGARMAGENLVLQGGRVHGRYDLEADEFVLDDVTLAGGRTQIRGEARLANASALLRAQEGEVSTFTVSLPSLALNAPGVFAEPFDLQAVRAEGSISAATGVIALTKLEATRGQARLAATGRLRFERVGAQQKLYPGIQLNGTITGPLAARDVVALWPVHFIEGARSYLDTAIEEGVASNVRLALNIPPAEIAAKQLTNPSLNIAFDFSGGKVRFIETMSPLTGARGHALLEGNRFNLTMDDARLEGLAVSRATVAMPILNPKGEMVTISARAEGDVRNMVTLLMQDPIALGERMPLDPATVGGRGAVQMTLQRPNRADVPFSALRFTVEGDLADVSGTMRENGMRVQNGRVHVSGNQSAITLSGPGRVASSDVNLEWTERLGDNITNSSRYHITGLFTVDDLETLGYPARAVARGRIGVDLTGEGQGFDIATGQVALDLRNASAFLPRDFWTKRQGQPATAQFAIARTPERGYQMSNIVVDGSGISARGQVRLTQEGLLRDGELSRFTVADRADLAISMRRGADNALEFTARGAMVDAAPFLGAEEPDGRARAAAAETPAAAPTPGQRPLVMRIGIRSDRLKLRGGADLSGATADMTLVDGALQTLIAQGRTPENKAFSLALGPRPGVADGAIAFQTDDAGFAWRGFTGADNIIGGEASAAGSWRMGPPGVAQINLTMHNFSIVKLGAMAQLLGSVGSLTGLVEMLNGDGIGFTSLEAPITMDDDTITIGQTRLAGPSLGFTASGTYDMKSDDLDIDGVVVPSYGLNSFVSNIPVLGNLLASRRGEGVFGMTYAINGPAATPRVGVNPLSALTPGILRRIFEPFQRRRPPPAAETAQPAPSPG